MSISPVMPTYARVDLAFEQGEGVWLIGTDGRRYLDFTSGVAVNALGHAHPKIVAAIAVNKSIYLKAASVLSSPIIQIDIAFIK